MQRRCDMNTSNTAAIPIWTRPLKETHRLAMEGFVEYKKHLSHCKSIPTSIWVWYFRYTRLEHHTWDFSTEKMTDAKKVESVIRPIIPAASFILKSNYLRPSNINEDNTRLMYRLQMYESKGRLFGHDRWKSKDPLINKVLRLDIFVSMKWLRL